MAHVQHDLFRPMLAKHHARQRTLFEEGPRETSLSCCECGQPLVETQSGFLCCPAGHGKLLAEEEPRGSWFESDTNEE